MTELDVSFGRCFIVALVVMLGVWAKVALFQFLTWRRQTRRRQARLRVVIAVRRARLAGWRAGLRRRHHAG